jgi:threonine/homoserine/homoserine lactone efflux protein
MMYVGTTGAQRGAATGALAALAIVLGGVCYTVMTAVGISALIAARPAIFIAIRVAGTLYLIWLGVRLLRRARDTSAPPPLPDAGSRAFAGGVAIALTNPQLALFFLAFLPQFVVVGDGPISLQLLKLGLTFNTCTLTVMMTVAVVTGIAGKMQTGGVRFRQVMRAIAGMAFLLLAAQTTWKLIG